MIETLLYALVFLTPVAVFTFIACEATKSFEDIPREKIVIKDDVIIRERPHLPESENGGWKCPDCGKRVTVSWDPPWEEQKEDVNYTMKITCESCGFSANGILFVSKGIITY